MEPQWWGTRQVAFVYDLRLINVVLVVMVVVWNVMVSREMNILGSMAGKCLDGERLPKE